MKKKRPRAGAEKKKGSSKKSKKDKPTPSFLDVVQVFRNGLLRENREWSERAAERDRLRALRDSAASVSERNRLALEALLDVGKRPMPVEDFDRRVVPLLRERARRTDAELISSFDVAFGGGAPAVERMPPDVCPSCGCERLEVPEESVQVCPGCGEQVEKIDATAASLPYGMEVEYTVASYKRGIHLQECINNFQAKETKRVPEPIVKRVVGQLVRSGARSLGDVTFLSVKAATKALSLDKYYAYTMQIWCRITGKDPVRLFPRCQEQIRLMFHLIEEPFERHRPRERKNFLSYPYCIYKFLDLLGHWHLRKYWALLKGKVVLQVQEDIFEKICKDLGWDFWRIGENPYEAKVEWMIDKISALDHDGVLQHPYLVYRCCEMLGYDNLWNILGTIHMGGGVQEQARVLEGILRELGWWDKQKKSKAQGKKDGETGAQDGGVQAPEPPAGSPGAAAQGAAGGEPGEGEGAPAPRPEARGGAPQED